MTVQDFFISKTSIGRREEFEHDLRCTICNNLMVTPLSTGNERMVWIEKTGYWAVCSEECFNMLVFQKL